MDGVLLYTITYEISFLKVIFIDRLSTWKTRGSTSSKFPPLITVNQRISLERFASYHVFIYHPFDINRSVTFIIKFGMGTINCPLFQFFMTAEQQFCRYIYFFYNAPKWNKPHIWMSFIYFCSSNNTSGSLFRHLPYRVQQQRRLPKIPSEGKTMR